MEEHVYVCGWEQSETGFRLWLKDHPFSKAEGGVLEEAMERLIQGVRESGGAVTPFFEFSPPLPYLAAEKQYYRPELVLLCGDDRFVTDEPRIPPFSLPEDREASERWYEQFFSGPCCRKCRTPKGGRTQQPLGIKHISTGYDGGFALLGSRTIKFFSENFLSLLTLEERQALHFQPVRREARSRNCFYELVGPAGPSAVAVRGLEPSGWQCPECCHRSFAYFSQTLSCRHFVAREALPSPLPHMFVFDAADGLELCVAASRWQEMVGKKGARGILSTPLGVVGEEQLNREPRLKKFS